jgi:hypothetical protein
VRKGRLVLVIAASLAVVSALIAGALVLTRDAATAPEPFFDNLLENPSFEGGQSNNLIDTIRWVDGTGPLYNLFGNIYTPDGWRVWWREGDTSPVFTATTTARPESRLVTTSPDPVRVHSGDQAASMFTFFRLHNMGLMQIVTATIGAHYDLTAWAHSWYSTCSTRPHDPPFDNDCTTRLWDSHDLLQVCIDPTGGIDPNGPDVVCSVPIEQYGGYSQRLELLGVEAQAQQVTVFLRARNNYPLRHNDVYWDDVTLEPVENIYLPLVMGGVVMPDKAAPVLVPMAGKAVMYAP